MERCRTIISKPRNERGCRFFYLLIFSAKLDRVLLFLYTQIFPIRLRLINDIAIGVQIIVLIILNISIQILDSRICLENLEYRSGVNDGTL